MKTKVQVKDLKAGDTLGSGTKVLAGPLPSPEAGKLMLYVEYPNGNKKEQNWGKYTTVTVNR